MQQEKEMMAMHDYLKLHLHHVNLTWSNWTIYPSVMFGRNVQLGSFVVIENNCWLGSDVLVGNGTVMRPNTRIGSNTKVGHLVVFEGETEIGSDCVIQSQCHITKGAEIGDKVFMGPGVIGINDRKICHMRREVMNYKEEPFSVGVGARIGSGSILLPGVIVGENAVVAAGAVVTRNVPPRKVVIGSPAKIVADVPQEEWI